MSGCDLHRNVDTGFADSLLTCSAVLTTLVIWRTDWDAETERARVRMGVDKRVIEEDEDSDSGSSQ